MGYITYSLQYSGGEVWNETRPFWDHGDMMRLTSREYTEMLAEEYCAERVFVVSVHTNNGEMAPVAEMRVV